MVCVTRPLLAAKRRWKGGLQVEGWRWRGDDDREFVAARDPLVLSRASSVPNATGASLESCKINYEVDFVGSSAVGFLESGQMTDMYNHQLLVEIHARV